MLPAVLTLTGSLLITVGSVVPYSHLKGTTVFFPADVPFSEWWPSATEPVLAILSSLILGIWLMWSRAASPVVAGLLLAGGALTIARYLAYAIHFHYFAGGGVLGTGGLVGVAGGACILLAGAVLLARSRGTPSQR
jgi:hypothetical protein